MSVYFIVDVAEVVDEEEYAEFLSLVRPIIKNYGGKYLCMGGLSKDLAGGWSPANLAVIEFSSRAVMDKCFGSTEFRELIPMRDRSSVTRLMVAEGMDDENSERAGLPEWQWNDRVQVGTDYSDLNEVERYDSRMGEFRDIDLENRAILELLSMRKGARFLEIGCGTGRLALMAAERCCDVTVADVSPMMLSYVSNCAKKRKLEVQCINKGFLELPNDLGEFDVVVSGAALHHLPDIWKTVAVGNVYNLLGHGGQFLLRDVIFDWDNGKYAEFFRGFVDSFPKETRVPAARHAAQEYSTHDWIMQGILERAGFNVLSNTLEKHSFRQYHCRKI